MIGTVINSIAVLIGGSLGLTIGARFPDRMKETVVAGLGLFTIFIGFQSALEMQNPLIVLGSLVIGAVLGEIAHIEGRVRSFGHWLQNRYSRRSTNQARFVEGFLTASLVFCVGPLAIQGAIEDGLLGDYTKLVIKSILDGVASLAFATTLGSGVLASVIVILVYQGGLTFLAAVISPLLTGSMVTELTAVGGVILISIGLRLLELRSIRSANLLPALVIAPLLVALLELGGIVF